jgi:hypothetical protein
MKQKIALKGKKKKIRKQMNGKCNNVRNADENKKISLQQFLPV